MSKDITLNVNGIDHHVNIQGNETLLKILRDKLGLTAAKEGCGAGECGACAVIYDGSPASSCLILAVEAEGVEILTLEGITPQDHLHPIQQSFIDKGAVQCGFCTPGIIVASR
ncbi:2Fe-2S iron-sulfur cluster binding domain-containing protein, partial [bacterium]|nr:2Fe-2S iron-sulfur cluster binding domain-containing protein [bacterium]